MKKKQAILILSVLLIGFIPFSAFADTFYVRPNGNDANSGKANTSRGTRQSIQKAANTIIAGDTAADNFRTIDTTDSSYESEISNSGPGAKFSSNASGRQNYISQKPAHVSSNITTEHPLDDYVSGEMMLSETALLEYDPALEYSNIGLDTDELSSHNPRIASDDNGNVYENT